MSRASGNITARSSRNSSRQGTIHTENPELLNLLKTNSPPPQWPKPTPTPRQQKTPPKTPIPPAGGTENAPESNSGRTSNLENREIFDSTPRKVADRVKFAPELGAAEDSGPEVQKEAVNDVTKERDADSGHYEGDEYLASSVAADSGNFEPNSEKTESVSNNKNSSGIDSEKTQDLSEKTDLKRQGTFTGKEADDVTTNTDNPPSKQSTARDPSKEDQSSNAPLETQPASDNFEIDKQHTLKESEPIPGDDNHRDNNKQRFVSVNWDSENFETGGDKSNSVSDNAPQGTRPVRDEENRGVDFDRQTLKSTNSFNSELARLHSPSRKSLNIDLQEEDDGKGSETVNPPGAEDKETQQQADNPGPQYSAVSPRQSRSSFKHDAAYSTAAATPGRTITDVRNSLEDPANPRFTTPYSSQRLKPRGDLAKRTASVRSDLPAVPNTEQLIKQEEDKTVDSLEIEKDSLDLEEDNTEQLEETSLTKKQSTSGLHRPESPEKKNEFSEDSLNSSVDTNNPTVKEIVEQKNSPQFLNERSDSEDTLVDEHIGVLSVSQNEKDLSAPANQNIGARKAELDLQNQQPEPVNQVEFVIKADQIKPGLSRYSSAAGSGRHSNSYYPLDPISSATTPKSSSRHPSGTTSSRRKVYVESPTFTKEEEVEYRFVRSRLDDIQDTGKFDTYRELDTSEIQRRESAPIPIPIPKPRTMPEKRVRYTDIDQDYREKELAIYSMDGRSDMANGVAPPAGYSNMYSSTDESDKENRRNMTYGNERPDHLENYDRQQQQQQPRHMSQYATTNPQYATTNPQYATTNPQYATTNPQNQGYPMPRNHRPMDEYNQPPLGQHGIPIIANRMRPRLQQPTSHHEEAPHHGVNPSMMYNPPPSHHSHGHHQHHPHPQQQQQQYSSQRPMFTPPEDLPQQLPLQQPANHTIGNYEYQQEQLPPPPPPPQQQQQQHAPAQTQPTPKVRGLSLPTGPSYDPVDEEDLEQERHYQQSLKSRIDSGNRRVSHSVISRIDLKGGPASNDNNDTHITFNRQDPSRHDNGYYGNPAHTKHSQPFVQDSLDYETEDTARDPAGGGYFHRDSLDVNRQNQQQQQHQYPHHHIHQQQQQQQNRHHQHQQYPMASFQGVPDEVRYEVQDDEGTEDYSDYEHLRGQRPNPHVQPRFYNPQFDQSGAPSDLNTDRSQMDNSNTFRADKDGYHYQGENNDHGDNRRRFYDPNENDDNMELVHPSPPKYDFVSHNKGDYGKTPSKSYKRIHEINKEEKEKLDDIFIHPKTKPKGGILKKRAGSQASVNSDPQVSRNAQRMEEPFPPHLETVDDSGLSTAEQVWARRASTLASRLDGKGGKKKGGAPSMQKYNSDSSINQIAPNHGHNSYQQLRQAHNQYHLSSPQHHPHHQQQHMSHQRPPLPPQQHYQQQQQQQPPQQQQLQPKAPPRDGRAFLTEMPTPVNEQNSQFAIPPSPRQELNLQPVTQQIITEDGQRISVDVNLKLISPPPPHQQHQQQQHLHQQSNHMHQDYYSRGYGKQYPAVATHYADDGGGDDGGVAGGSNHSKWFGDAYGYPSPRDSRDRYSADDALRALTDSRTATNPYGKVPPILPPYNDRDVPNSAPATEESGSYMDAYLRQKRQEDKPWYKVYNMKDFRRMKKEVHLGTLGPDLDSEVLRERKEKAQRQSEYAKNVMAKNKTSMVGKKPPSFPRPNEQDDIMNRRKVAVEYAKSVPKPTVKPRATEFNNYELASEKSPIARVHKVKKSPSNTSGKLLGHNASQNPPPSLGQEQGADKDIETMDLDRMRQRYEEDKQNEAVIRRNTGSVGGNRNYYDDS